MQMALVLELKVWSFLTLVLFCFLCKLQLKSHSLMLVNPGSCFRIPHKSFVCFNLINVYWWVPFSIILGSAMIWFKVCKELGAGTKSSLSSFLTQHWTSGFCLLMFSVWKSRFSITSGSRFCHYFFFLSFDLLEMLFLPLSWLTCIFVASHWQDHHHYTFYKISIM
jgi:hypothetical protein